MASKRLLLTARPLWGSASRASYAPDSLMQCLAPRLSRSMATEVPLPTQSIAQPYSSEITTSLDHSASNGLPPHVPVTIYNFPSMEPIRFHSYPSNHLHLPLRRDILHRAVIYEGDSKRKGLAHTKWRDEVHGSGRKIRPQKGTGMARLGDKKSPMLRGGGAAFGPKPRDFSTELPRKLYDQAWRIALSYRYRKGELVVCNDGMNIRLQNPSYLKLIFEKNRWGNADGRSLVVTKKSRLTNLHKALMSAGQEGRALGVDELDVKALLELGRVIIEKSALDRIFKEHSSDLGGA